MSTSLIGQLSAPTRPELPAVARAFAQETGSLGAIILVSDGDDLTVGAAYPPDPAGEAALHVPVGQGVTGLVARNGHAIQLGADTPRNPAHRHLLGIDDAGAVARLCLPARGIDGEILGVVSLHRDTAHPYTDADLTRVQPYADLLGLRLQARGLMNAVDAHRSDRDRLIAAAISAQEDERRRIASDLHDGATTALASMSFHLNAADLSIGAAERAQDGAAAADALAQARSQIAVAKRLGDMAYHQTRAAITGLHSLVLDDLGLVAAIESLAETAPGVAVELESDPQSALDDVPDHAATALFRIAQETLSNAVKHARATTVRLTLHRDGEVVVLSTIDDGVGFDPRREPEGRTAARADGAAAGHFGLSSIAERCALVGASLRIDSAPGQGTTVIVELPVGPAAPTTPQTAAG